MTRTQATVGRAQAILHLTIETTRRLKGEDLEVLAGEIHRANAHRARTLGNRDLDVGVPVRVGNVLERPTGTDCRAETLVHVFHHPIHHGTELVVRVRSEQILEVLERTLCRPVLEREFEGIPPRTLFTEAIEGSHRVLKREQEVVLIGVGIPTTERETNVLTKNVTALRVHRILPGLVHDPEQSTVRRAMALRRQSDLRYVYLNRLCRWLQHRRSFGLTKQNATLGRAQRLFYRRGAELMMTRPQYGGCLHAKTSPFHPLKRQRAPLTYPSVFISSNKLIHSYARARIVRRP